MEQITMVFSFNSVAQKVYSFFQNRVSMYRILNMYRDPASSPLLTYLDDEPKLEEDNVTPDEVVVDHDSQSTIPSLSEALQEIKNLCTIAFPMIITGLLVYGKSAISMHFLGVIGKDELAGGSLAIGIANITGYSVISGLASGMEGISSQACGARQWPLMGQTLQRTIVILIIACIPISILWLYMQPILTLCGQNPSISSIAAIYLASSLPDLFFQSFIHPLKIFLRTQNITLPLLYSAAIALGLQFPINYIVTHILCLGIRGVALAGAFTNLNLLLIVLFYLRLSGCCSKSWRGWSCQCFSHWKPILRQALPCCFSICLEWWWYEILIILSGLLHNAADTVATSGIIIQATALSYNFPYALSLAVSTRVGNELGANRPDKAKTSSLMALFFAILTGFISMAFMVIMRTYWGHFFTKDEAILSPLAQVLPIVGLCELGNCPQTTICGVLRGSARPSLGARINFVSFYCVGLPVAIVMCFRTEMGYLGLWMGLLAAQLVCVVAMMVVLMRTDWKEEAEKARELTAGMNGSNEDNNKRMCGCLLCYC